MKRDPRRRAFLAINTGEAGVAGYDLVDLVHGREMTKYLLIRSDGQPLANHRDPEGLKRMQRIFESLGVKCLGVKRNTSVRGGLSRESNYFDRRAKSLAKRAVKRNIDATPL